MPSPNSVAGLLVSFFGDNQTAQQERQPGRHGLATIGYNTPTRSQGQPNIDIPIATERVAQIEQFLHKVYAQNTVINDDWVLTQTGVHGVSIYDHMLDTDGHLYAAADQLVGGAAHVQYHIKAARSDDPGVQDRYDEHAEFIRAAFEEFDFHEELKKPYWSHPKGFSLCEIVYKPFAWKWKDSNWRTKLVIDHFFEIPIEMIAMDTGYRPHIRIIEHPVEGVLAEPKLKFLFMRRGGGAYGSPLLRRCFKSWWFKLNGQVAAIKYMKGWANPRVAAWHDTEQQMSDNLMMLKKLSEEDITYATFPRLDGLTGAPLAIMESQHPYDFTQMNTYWDDENSKVMTSSTRTLSSSDAMGTHAATSDHAEALNERQLSLAKSGRRQVVNGQLVRNLIDFNFGPQLRYPSYELGMDEEDTPAEYLDKFGKATTSLVAANIPFQFSASEFRDKTGFMKPVDASDILQLTPPPKAPAAGPGGLGANFL